MKETEETRGKEYDSLKPKFIENGMKLSEVRAILNNVIAATTQLAELYVETGQAVVETVQQTKKLSDTIDSIQEAITTLDQRITALEKPKQ